MARVCQPTSSSAEATSASAYTISNQTALSDHISVVKAWFPEMSCCAMSQRHGA